MGIDYIVVGSERHICGSGLSWRSDSEFFSRTTTCGSCPRHSKRYLKFGGDRKVQAQAVFVSETEWVLRRLTGSPHGGGSHALYRDAKSAQTAALCPAKLLI
jgi:hypothetical protein